MIPRIHLPDTTRSTTVAILTTPFCLPVPNAAFDSPYLRSDIACRDVLLRLLIAVLVNNCGFHSSTLFRCYMTPFTFQFFSIHYHPIPALF